MDGYKIRYTYQNLDVFQQAWEKKNTSVLRLVFNVLIHVFIIILTSYYFEVWFNKWIATIMMVLSATYLLITFIELLIVPVLYYKKLKKLGEIQIEYSDEGITVITNDEEISNHWSEYEKIIVREHSFSVERRNIGPVVKIPNRVFGNKEKFSSFVSYVESKLS